jgi:hypothetical protein
MKLLHFAPKSAKTHVRTYTISKNFQGRYPRILFKKGRGGEDGGWEGGEERRVEGWGGEGGDRGIGGKGKRDVCIHASGDQRRWIYKIKRSSNYVILTERLMP